MVAETQVKDQHHHAMLPQVRCTKTPLARSSPVPLCTVQSQRRTPNPDTDGGKSEHLLNNCLIYFSGLFYLSRVNVDLLRKSEKKLSRMVKTSRGIELI